MKPKYFHLKLNDAGLYPSTPPPQNADPIKRLKMAESGDLEKKGVDLDGTLADDRSTSEGQVYRSEAHADLNSERRYGESPLAVCQPRI